MGPGLPGLERSNLERAGRMLDLERGVFDPEALAQQPGQLLTVLLCVAVGSHEHVRRERGEARGDLPDVQVVDLHYVRLGRERAADLRRVELTRRGLEQDPAGVAQ